MEGKCIICNKGGIEIMHSNEQNIQIHPGCIEGALEKEPQNPRYLKLKVEFKEAIAVHRVVIGKDKKYNPGD